MRSQAPIAAELAGQALHEKLERRLAEACRNCGTTLSIPRSLLGRRRRLAAAGRGGGRGGGLQSLFINEQQLREIRIECRLLAATNEFAINGHENRISYLVGQGHTYRATTRKGHAADARWSPRRKKSSTLLCCESKWHRRQQEIVRRLDRDGEVFLRFFVDPAGGTRSGLSSPTRWPHRPMRRRSGG